MSKRVRINSFDDSKKKGMSRRSFFIPMTGLLIFPAILTGCGKEKTVKKPKRGHLYRIPVEEEGEQEFIAQQKQLSSDKRNPSRKPEEESSERIVCNSLPDMLLALNSGRIDYFRTTSAVAAFLANRDPSLSIVSKKSRTKFYRMAVLPKNRDLCERLDEAITALKKDGTLNDLQKIHIDGANAGGTPEKTVLPVFKEAKTIRAAITGDLPPMDYISEDGTPAGYDLAILSALANYLKINIEPVPMNSAARMTALSSGKVDVLFWTEMDLENYQGNGGIILTKSYRSDSVAFVARDFPIDQIKILDHIPAGGEEDAVR